MKLASISSAVLFIALLLGGCSDQKQVGTAPVSEKSAIGAPPPTHENFDGIVTKLDAPAFGNVDGINDVTSPKAGSTLAIKGDKIVIGGNFVDAVKGDAAAGVIAVIDGKPFVSTYGGQRPDIAKAHNNPKYLNSQFYIEIPTSSVGTGLHDLKIRVIATDKSGYYESEWFVKLAI